MQLFSEAKESVTLMSSYFWPGRKMLRKMAAASGRGVSVRVMLAGVSDIPIAKSAERYIYRRLFRNNIEVYEYQDNILHGKVAVADNCFVTIGSYNVNNISAYASLELNLDIKDDSFAASVNRELDTILRKDCLRITEESFTKKYHFFQRLWQQIAFDVVHIIFFLFTFYFRQKEAKRMSRALKE
jgi:cardiolipin synthase